MKRREFLKRGLAAAATAALSPIAAKDAALASTPGAKSSTSSLPDLDRLTGRVVLPGDPSYDDARIGRNTRVCSSPAVIVFCSQVDDVVNAVNWARIHSIPLRARCGRHSYEGYSSVDGGIVIDVSGIVDFHYNSASGTARLGSGMSLGDAYEALGKYGMTFPGGSCPTVGLSGHALGGGYGLLARHLGLACDNVLEVEIVMADGSVVRANEREHPDLYWASRGGGGGNFGIVTFFLFKAHPIGKVSIFRLVWKWEDMESVLDAWQSWAPNTDKRLTSVLVMRSTETPFLAATGQFVGHPDELAELIEPLKAAGPVRKSSLYSVEFMEAVKIFSGQKPDHEGLQMHWTPEDAPFKHSSDYADRPLGDDAAEIIRHALENAPNTSCFVQIEAYGGAVGRVAPDATAFAHRAALCNMQYQTYWRNSQEPAPFVVWVEDLRRSMQPYVSGGAYCNYSDSEIPDWPQAYYGANLDRLMEVKKRYDPGNLIRFPQSIPPAA